jgi:CRP-like cAMP-binding protein
MKRYRYVELNSGDSSALNRLLTYGWRPVRELPLSTAKPVGGWLMLLERDEELPLHQGEHVMPGVPFSKLLEYPALAGMTADAARELIAACQQRAYPAESVVFAEESTDRDLHLVLTGEIDVSLAETGGEDISLLRARSGDVLGEASFFSGAPHSARAVAVADSTTLCLTHAAFEELLQAGRPAATWLTFNMAALLGARLQAADQWAAEVTRQEEHARSVRTRRRYRESLIRPADMRGGFFGPA